MLTLRTSAASPFGRKIRIAVEVLGMGESVRLEPADTSDASDSLRQQNPLGKVPTLVLPDGQALFDSRVIIEYLDVVDGRGILIPRTEDRIRVLRHQALADGLLDAALLQVYEARFRPESHRLDSWLDYQREKVERALLAFASDIPGRRSTGVHIGEIALAVALGYLDFRFQGKWRTTYPVLVDWLQEFDRRVPAFGGTAPPL
ncbi:glutathione S-transferase family protein [Variovorax defluvii]|uniref:Glutathione S-transferase family protein n=1 Tax=Variovorax defluvii TaxID=913761 RepID=A0ABP8H4N6_9BURK